MLSRMSDRSCHVTIAILRGLREPPWWKRLDNRVCRLLRSRLAVEWYRAPTTRRVRAAYEFRGVPSVPRPRRFLEDVPLALVRSPDGSVL